MSTRCNILIKDKRSQQWFYRHSDGYPSCTANSLKTFIKWLVDGKIRDNVCQGSPWLIILGNNETNNMIAKIKRENKKREHQFTATHEAYGGGKKPCIGMSGWQVGCYEITDDEHGDIVFLYTIHLTERTVKIEGRINATYTFEEFLKTEFCEKDDYPS